jgi:hypothetical protein
MKLSCSESEMSMISSSVKTEFIYSSSNPVTLQRPSSGMFRRATAMDADELRCHARRRVAEVSNTGYRKVAALSPVVVFVAVAAAVLVDVVSVILISVILVATLVAAPAFPLLILFPA